METCTYLRKREDGLWARVITDAGDPARVLDYGILSEAEALELLSETEPEYVAERRKD